MTDDTKKDDAAGKAGAAQTKPDAGPAKAKVADRAGAGDIPKPSPPEADKPVKPRARRMLRVVAKQPVRWRIGRRFGADPVDLDPETLDDLQIEALRADPLLVVTEQPPKSA
jgi:hypothetical protein